jgi:hypothetical protein
VPEMGHCVHPCPAPEIQGAIFSYSPGIKNLNPGVFEGMQTDSMATVQRKLASNLRSGQVRERPNRKEEER